MPACSESLNALTLNLKPRIGLEGNELAVSDMRQSVPKHIGLLPLVLKIMHDLLIS